MTPDTRERPVDARGDEHPQTWHVAAWRSDDPALKHAQLALLAAEYGSHEIATPEYYDWQYLHNPCGEAIGKLAVAEHGQLAGQYVVLPIQLTIGGHTHDGVLSVQTVTARLYRGRGIFTGLADAVYAECAKRGRSFVLGFPNPNSYPGFVRTLRFRHLGDLPLLVRPLKPSRLVEAKYHPPWSRLLGALVLPVDLLYRPASEAFDRIVKVERFDGSFDVFDRVLTRRFAVHQPRTARFLNWRFLDGPREYAAYGWYDGSLLRGYVVLRSAAVSGLASGLLVDFFVDDGADAGVVGSGLVRFALGRLSAMGAHLAGALANRGTTELAILKRNGFWVCPRPLLPQPYPVVFKPTVEGWETGKPVASLAGWALGMGDYDAV